MADVLASNKIEIPSMSGSKIEVIGAGTRLEEMTSLETADSSKGMLRQLKITMDRNGLTPSAKQLALTALQIGVTVILL